MWMRRAATTARIKRLQSAPENPTSQSVTTNPSRMAHRVKGMSPSMRRIRGSVRRSMLSTPKANYRNFRISGMRRCHGDQESGSVIQLFNSTFKLPATTPRWYSGAVTELSRNSCPPVLCSAQSRTVSILMKYSFANESSKDEEGHLGTFITFSGKNPLHRSENKNA